MVGGSVLSGQVAPSTAPWGRVCPWEEPDKVFPRLLWKKSLQKREMTLPGIFNTKVRDVVGEPQNTKQINCTVNSAPSEDTDMLFL